MKIIDFPTGVYFHTRSNDSKFLAEQKKILNLLRITWYDPCCSTEATLVPVRFNVETDVLERVDPATGNYVTATFTGAAYFPQAAQNNITAGTGGAIPVTNYLTTINTDAGGDAFTLANGTTVGQMKKILLVVDGGGDGVVTPTSLSGGTTITFDDATDYVVLQWNGTAWVVLENFGVTVA